MSYGRIGLAHVCVALAVAALSAGCSRGSTTPTPVDPGVPILACPAPPQPVQAPDSSGALVAFGAASATGGTPPLAAPTCSAVSGSKFPVGTTTVTCNVSDAKSRSASPCSFAVVVTPAPVVPRLAVTKFLAFGDSITWGEDGRNSASSPFQTLQLRPAVQFDTPNTYPGALETVLRVRYSTQSPTVTNAGLRAELVTGSGTFSRFVSWTSTGQYDALLLLEGANDIGDRDSRIFSSVIAGLRRMIQDAKGRGMKVMLATLTPENPAGFRGLAWSTVPLMNDQIRALASSEGVVLVDLFEALNGNVSTYIGFDGLHPTDLGYHKIADTFAAAIKSNFEVSPTTSSATRTRR
jgi:lysophospholipase L1-like esterase